MTETTIRKVAICSGGFDPLHRGHIQYLKGAKARADVLIVGVNSDAWLARKKKTPFLPYESRKAIVECLKPVSLVLPFDDSHDHAVDLIRKVVRMYAHADSPFRYKFLFCNGGDRTAENIPEMISEFSGVVDFVFGVGGSTKLDSSSSILKKYVQNV